MHCATPHSTDAIVKPPEQMMKMRLRPNRLAPQPTGAVMMAAATMYEVNTQLIWSCDADSVPCMYGSATLAMVVSSACMMVAVMAQIVTMFRRKPGTMLDGGAVAVIAKSVLVVIRIRRRRREAEQAGQRTAMIGVDRRVHAHASFQLADEF